MRPVRLRSEIVPRGVRKAFEPGYEALAIEVVFDEERAQEAHLLMDVLPASFEDSIGHVWPRIGASPIGRDRIRITVATPLDIFFKGDSGLEERLLEACDGALEVVMESLGKTAV